MRRSATNSGVRGELEVNHDKSPATQNMPSATSCGTRVIRSGRGVRHRPDFAIPRNGTSPSSERASQRISTITILFAEKSRKPISRLVSSELVAGRIQADRCDTAVAEIRRDDGKGGATGARQFGVLNGASSGCVCMGSCEISRTITPSPLCWF